MKKIIVTLCSILFLYMALRSCDDRTEQEKLVLQTIYNIANKMENRYQLEYIGRVEAANKAHYKLIGLKFRLYYNISKEEGRKILVDTVGELLSEINSNSKLLPYLNPSPFTAANVEITLFVYHTDGTFAYYPELGVFSARNGILSYASDTPEPRYKLEYFTEEKESYEEALEIVKAQAEEADRKP